MGRTAASLLSPGGRYLVYGWVSEPGRFAEFSEQELAELDITSERAGLAMFGRPGGMQAAAAEALAEAASGRFRPLVQRFGLSDAAAAHVALETPATVGKIVLIP